MKYQALLDLENAGIRMPQMYLEGFPHHNCGGFCCKAGQAQFALLHAVRPAYYAYNESKERDLREYLSTDSSVLIDRRGGEKKRMTMERFRNEIEDKATPMLFDKEEWGGCGCFTDESEEG